MTTPVVVLTRVSSSLQGTVGVLSYGDFQCATLELPWLNNSQGISAIPPLEYDVKMTYSPKYKRPMYLVFNVPKRSGIRIHSANYAGSVKHGYKCDLLGCIALGTGITKVAGQTFLMNSRVTVKKFEKLMQGKPFILQIKEA